MKRICSFFALAVALAACQHNIGAPRQAPAGSGGVQTSSGSSNSKPDDDDICSVPDTTAFTAPTVIADLADGLSSDGRGPYIKGTDGVIASVINAEAALTIWVRNPDSVSNLRAFTMNLSKPVPGGGGVPLGVVSSGNAVGLITQLRAAGPALRNLNAIAIGKTVTAAQMNVAFRIGGRKHVLQMGPQANGHCETLKNVVHGKGTSAGTVYRASRTKWVMDLPAGSVGRLFDLKEGWEHAVDRGLYYVHMHYEIGQ